MAESGIPKRSKWIVFFFNIACLALACLFATWIVRVWSNPAGVQARKDTSAGPLAGPQGDKPIVVTPDYKKDLDLLEKEIATQDKALAGERDELTRITDISRILITVAGVFAFFLGLGSWALLRDQRKDARESLETDRQAAADALDAKQKEFESQIKESVAESKGSIGALLDESHTSLNQVGSLRDELERDFPMFGRMRSNFQKILSGLAAACSQLDETDDSYTKLSWDEVQRIFYYESAISTSLLLNTAEHAKQLSEIYRLLGVFYGSRFAFDKAGKIGTVPTDVRERAVFFSDLNRARFYFDRSIEFDPDNYVAHFDAGFFTQYNDDLPLARISRDHFKTAAIIGSQYQKPYISIALLELEAFRDPGAALVALDRAEEKKQYNVDRTAPAKDYIAYLRACALCLQIHQTPPPEDSASLQRAVSILSDACSGINQYFRADFDSDIESFFHVLKESPTTAEQFDLIAEKMRSS